MLRKLNSTRTLQTTKSYYKIDFIQAMIWAWHLWTELYVSKETCSKLSGKMAGPKKLICLLDL